MSAGKYERAVRALQETTRMVSPDVHGAVEPRLWAVLNDMHRPVRSSRGRWAFAVAAAMLVGLFGSWAGATGRLAPVLYRVTSWIGPSRTSSLPQRAVVRPSRPVVHIMKPPVRDSEPHEAPLPTRQPEPPVAKAKPLSSEVRLYDQAHRAQFAARDNAGAVRAWDAYLAAHPNGRLAPEAHYNRAIALFRLGRLAESAAELTPFADGAYGEYRRADARALLSGIRRVDRSPK